MDIQKSLKLITEYIDLGLFSSADDHCSLMLSSRKLGQFETVCTLEKMIDALILKEEYRRAIMYVGNAIQTLGSSKSDSISAQYASLKFKEANCFMKLRDYASSLKSLEAIPHMHRTLQVSLLLVNCYKLSNMKRQACSVQLQVLKHLPMSTEIIEDLINANVSSRDILKVLHQSNMLSNTSGVSSAYIDLNMMSMIVGALEAKKNLHYNEAKSKFDKLLHVYPGNRFVLKHAAECYALSGHSKEAMIVYQQLHTQDPLYMHRLDTWGFLLYEQYEKDGDKLSELYKLASNMMAISGGNSSNSDRKEKSRSNVSNQPESWVLAAMFAATQCDSRKTILFLEKAIAADPRHYMAYLFKGKFLASTDHFEKATIAYMMANSIFKTIYGYTGLVLAHLKCKDTREAGIAAKEAVTVFPGLAKSYILQATVLLDSLKNSDEYFTVVSNRKTIENDIMKTLDKAFAIDPVNVEVCLMKTEILLSKPSNVGIEEAITWLVIYGLMYLCTLNNRHVSLKR